MLMKNIDAALPGKALAYVLKAGEGRCNLVAGQVVHTLAGIEETAGGFGAMVCDAGIDRQAIPLHYHEREHDTWFCTRGRMKVWSDGTCRILTPGDFAYVKPGGVHSYQCIAPRSQFFGIVAPGGWENFFDDAGEPWSDTALPTDDHPFDFSRMGPAMGKHRIMRVEGASYAEPSCGDATDRALPEGPASYVLQAGYGARYRLNGHVATALLSRAGTQGMLDMWTITGGRGAEMPALRHGLTHVFLYLVDGRIALTLDGKEHLLSGGDAANIPAGTAYASRILSQDAQWVLAAAHGDGLGLWSAAGLPTVGYGHVSAGDARLTALPEGIDVQRG
ncbi:cupin domain-containing protein [Pseudooceanicola sp. GBMRC 2024]|uniref:Cupin domain-containing protein n=1 Tax=Pseudooceanicola albus TaxID=2692189 RepID=A0A6L7G0P8_9RHOB|nr:quercetin 2,3-dioxygenase family protein [Pseudooceanicola albus]MXN17904.1 cupin domain-containing protein [Pseudooceanicola albus]